MADKTHRLTLRIDIAEYMALKRYCTETNQTITGVLNFLVRRAIPDKYREERYKYDEWDL